MNIFFTIFALVNNANMEAIKDYIFKPVLKPDWFMFSIESDEIDFEFYYYKSMAELMKLVKHKKKDSWEKLVELTFHEFNLNLFLMKNVIFDYKYDEYSSKKVSKLFDLFVSGQIIPDDFVNGYIIPLRNSLEFEIEKYANIVQQEITESGLLYVINETNENMHDSHVTMPVFYKDGIPEIYVFMFNETTEKNMGFTYQHIAFYSGENATDNFKKFVKNKSALFNKSFSTVIYTLSDYDIKKAAGLYYTVHLLNMWMNRGSKYNQHIIGDVLSNVRNLDYTLSFTI